MPDNLRLSTGQLESIVEHSRANQPEEACGILAGDSDGMVRKVYLMENIEHSRSLYMMDAREQFQVFDEIDNNGLELVGIFHSHPHSEPLPSARDCKLAFYPDSVYLIVSLMNEKPESRAFRIVDMQVEEVEIVIVDPT